MFRLEPLLFVYFYLTIHKYVLNFVGPHLCLTALSS